MTTNNFPGRSQIDRAGDLDFDNRIMRGNDPRLFDNPKVDEKRAKAQPAADMLNTGADVQPAEKQANICIEVAPDGLHIRAEYTGTLSSIPAAIERLRVAGVLELVEASRPAAPAVAAAAPTKTAPARVDPSYNSAGDACCPVHRRKLSEGDYGLFCSAKAKDGQVADKKGYCGLKFNE